MPAQEIFELKCEINQLRSLKDDAQGKLHLLQSMMAEAGFPMRVKLGEDLEGNEDWARVRPETQLSDLISKHAELREFARDVRDNYDCDTGANGTHPHHCRCCSAGKLIGQAPRCRAD